MPPPTPPPSRVARLCVRVCGPPKPKAVPKPPTLGLANHYTQAAHSLAIVTSLGVVYPLVAVAGALKLCVDLYTLPRKLAAIGATHGAKLRPEGMSGLPTRAIIPVSVASVGLLYFVWGPHGMLKLDGANAIVIIAAVTALPLVIFSGDLAHRAVERWGRSQMAGVPLTHEQAGGGGALGQFVASFDVWAAEVSEATEEAEDALEPAGGGVGGGVGCGGEIAAVHSPGERAVANEATIN